MAQSHRVAERAASVSLIATAVVVFVKVVSAYYSNSVSVLAEALQSSIDVLVCALAVWAVRYASRPPDSSHPYGHGKAELLASALQMVIVVLAGAYILFECYQRFREPRQIEWTLGFSAMLFALVSNSFVIRYLLNAARTTDSEVLRSEAAHLRGDLISCLGVLVGMLLVGLTQIKWIDPLVAAIGAAFMIGIAIKQIIAVVHPLMDGALPPHELSILESTLAQNPHVKGFHDVRTRKIGRTRVVELHALLDDSLTFVEAHDLAEEIESELRAALKAQLVSIHYEPYEKEIAHREREHSGDQKT